MYDLEGDTQREALLAIDDNRSKLSSSPNKTAWKVPRIVAAGTSALLVMVLVMVVATSRGNHPIEFQSFSDQDELQVDFHRIDSISRPIPPLHPHHHATVRYTSRMEPGGNISYRREITAPCDHGMLLFSIGPARDDLPYKYDVYDDAYLFSDNKGLCIRYPDYTGYQVSKSPFWNPTDPMTIELKDLDPNKMHWISSREVNPSHSKKSVDKKIIGDYAVIAKHSFYTPHYYVSYFN